MGCRYIRWDIDPVTSFKLEQNDFLKTSVAILAQFCKVFSSFMLNPMLQWGRVQLLAGSVPIWASCVCHSWSNKAASLSFQNGFKLWSTFGSWCCAYWFIPVFQWTVKIKWCVCLIVTLPSRKFSTAKAILNLLSLEAFTSCRLKSRSKNS